jgi:hypothetical protein
MKNNDQQFARGFFRVVAFLLGTCPVVYGIYAHEWLLVAGFFSGGLSAAITMALNETK